MGRIEDPAERFRRRVALPWRRDLAGAERAVFVVYDKADERRLRARKALFELAATDAGHRWIECDPTGTFAGWMAGTQYREICFESPEDLGLKLEEDFRAHVAGRVGEKLAAPEADEDGNHRLLDARDGWNYANATLAKVPFRSRPLDRSSPERISPRPPPPVLR